MKGVKGFTLIELLIVIAILGILAAIVAPNVGQFMGAGKGEAAKTELANLQTSMDVARLDNALPEVEPVAIPGVNDFTGVDIAPGDKVVELYPNYMRRAFTRAVKKGGDLAQYSWNEKGEIMSTAIDPVTGDWQ